MSSLPIPAGRCHSLLDLLAQVPDQRKKRGRRHSLAGLLAVGIAAVIAGSRSFAAIGQWAADADPDVLAALGASRGAAEESTFRRTFALASADVLDRVLGAWLWTRVARPGGRLVIAIDGKAVRGARGKDGKAPHPGIRRDLITMPTRTARHGRGNLILHLPAGHHREQAWQNLWTDACGPPAQAA